MGLVLMKGYLNSSEWAVRLCSCWELLISVSCVSQYAYVEFDIVGVVRVVIGTLKPKQFFLYYDLQIANS